MTLKVSSMLWVLKSILVQHCPNWRKEFTVQPRASNYGDKEKPEPVVQYVERDDMVGLPVARGVAFAEQFGYEIEGATVLGKTLKARKFPDPNHASAVEEQEALFQAANEAVFGNYAALVELETGGGKTVLGLNTAGRLGRATLVIVTSGTLADQWVEEAKLHLGLLPEEIGLVQSGHFPFEGRQLVVAVIHNLIDRPLPEGFAKYFGMVIYDECHRMGAKEFSRSMPLFPACYKLGLTATPDRKDGCMSLVTDYFGSVAVSGGSTYMEAGCYPINIQFVAPPKLFGLMPILLKWLAKHQGRNKIIADAAFDLYSRGRGGGLVISDRVEHLQTLHLELKQRGVLEDEMGFYTGFRLADGKKKTIGEGYRRLLREDSKYKIILGTYAQMKEGVNIPRLDWGIDAMPQADGRQTIGRIRRRVPGKAMPLWFTPVDFNIPPLNAIAEKRIASYKAVGVTMYE